MKPPAFFSYARSDSAFALRLAADLKQGGANVWLDQLDIRPGRKWDIEVEQALHECQEIVVLLSPAATASNNVLDEVAFALEEGKTIIPVKLQNCRIPFRLRRVQYIDFMLSYDEAVKRLLLALAIEGQVQAFETGSGKDRQTSDGIHTGQQDHPSHPAQDSRETHAARSANAQWITEPEAVAPPYNLAENDRSRRQPEGDSNAERTVDNQHAASGPLEERVADSATLDYESPAHLTRGEPSAGIAVPNRCTAREEEQNSEAGAVKMLNALARPLSGPTSQESKVRLASETQLAVVRALIQQMASMRCGYPKYSNPGGRRLTASLPDTT